MSFFDVSASPVFDQGRLAAVKRVQEIPESHLKALDATRTAPNRASEFRMVCSIPVALVETWKAQGFDAMAAPAKEIVARLRRDQLDAFITSRI